MTVLIWTMKQRRHLSIKCHSACTNYTISCKEKKKKTERKTQSTIFNLEFHVHSFIHPQAIVRIWYRSVN